MIKEGDVTTLRLGNLCFSGLREDQGPINSFQLFPPTPEPGLTLCPPPLPLAVLQPRVGPAFSRRPLRSPHGAGDCSLQLVNQDPAPEKGPAPQLRPRNAGAQ